MNFDAIADYLDNENLKPIAMVSALGAGSAILAKYTVTQFGRNFTQFQSQTKFGIESLALLAVIGAIQQLAPFFLAKTVNNWFTAKEDDNYPNGGPSNRMAFFLSHQLVAASLVGLTALAAKTNWIASGLTLFAGVALFATSYCSNRVFLRLNAED